MTRSARTALALSRTDLGLARTALALALVGLSGGGAVAGEGLPSPSSRLRPIESEAAPRGVVQAAYMQAGDFAMPEMGSSAGAASPAPPPLQATDTPPSMTPLTPPPGYAPPATRAPATTAPPPQRPAPQTAAAQPQAAPPAAVPPGLTPVPRSGVGAGTGIPSAQGSPSDLAPVPQPQLNTEWATVGNCNLVSPASTYRAEFWGCGPSYVVPAGAPPYAAPQTIVPATVMPGTPVPGVVAPNPYVVPAGHRPLFTLGQENYNVQLGQGIIGQPTAYVPGQTIRNFIRYLSP